MGLLIPGAREPRRVGCDLATGGRASGDSTGGEARDLDAARGRPASVMDVRVSSRLESPRFLEGIRRVAGTTCCASTGVVCQARRAARSVYARRATGQPFGRRSARRGAGVCNGRDCPSCARVRRISADQWHARMARGSGRLVASPFCAARIGIVRVFVVSEAASMWHCPSKIPPASMTRQGA